MRLTLRFPLLCMGILLAVSCVVVKHGEERKGEAREGLEIYFANGNFDAKAYVAGMWDAKLLPYCRENAVDLAVLLKQLAADEAGTSKKYGWRQVAEGAPFNFAVKGEAVVRAVHTESRAGTADLDPAGEMGAAGKTDVILQIGPVFKGTSIRDALPFVVFDDFVNQLDYAALSNEFNAVVRDRVMPKIDPVSLSGKRLSFYGFITYERGAPVVVTAVEAEVK